MPPRNGTKPPTKAEILDQIQAKTSKQKSEISQILDALVEVAEENLKRHKEFKLLGLVKLKVVRKSARPARKGTNPATGKPMMLKAKPAYNGVRVSALKHLKDAVA